MDAAASTIVHRYRRLLFPSPRPPVPLVRPLGPLLPLLTVGDLLFSKKTYPNTWSSSPSRSTSARQTGSRGLRAAGSFFFFLSFFLFFFRFARAKSEDSTRERGRVRDSGLRPRLFIRPYLDHVNCGLCRTPFSILNFQFARSVVIVTILRPVCRISPVFSRSPNFRGANRKFH